MFTVGVVCESVVHISTFLHAFGGLHTAVGLPFGGDCFGYSAAVDRLGHGGGGGGHATTTAHAAEIGVEKVVVEAAETAETTVFSAVVLVATSTSESAEAAAKAASETASEKIIVVIKHARKRVSAAEKFFEDVLSVAHAAVEATEVEVIALHLRPVKTEPILVRPLLGVRQNFLCFRDFLEHFRSFRVALILVWVLFESQLALSLLD